MRSPVSWALLGLVIHRPSYGYELVQRFERIHGDSLELSSMSQIYTALDTLEHRGLIEEIAAENGEVAGVRQPKPHYRATAQGVSEHRQWLVGQLAEERRRSRLFVRQLAMLAAPDALAVIEQLERSCLREAATAGPVDGANMPVDGHATAERLLSEEQRLAADAKLSWILYARRQLTALATRPSARR
ncbi:MAG TPA: PadR family transcriptional regulator [Solirubrobacteraceae bacterium]|nr:PadR family transcriptional regulator [Solirubrobacteraceae bacterium]